MAPPSMENHHLLWYLEKYLSLDGSMELTSEPWNRETCLFVLTYIVQFCSNMDGSEFSHEIMALDEIAKSVHASYIKQQEQNGDDKKTLSQGAYVDEINKRQHEFSEMLVNSFIPDVVPRLFVVPKLHQLPDKDRHLKLNEILAGFINFLLQVLNHVSDSNEDEEQQNDLALLTKQLSVLLQVLCHGANTSEDEEQLHAVAVLRKQLSFLLAVLGDVPFQSGDHELAEDVENLLAEFEILANEAGILVYDCVFHIHPLETSRFDARANDLPEKFELLNAKIKEHCIKFAELPLSVISRHSVIDSFYIVTSLIADLENLLSCRLSITHGGDSIKDQMVTLHGELILLQTLITVPEIPDAWKEALIQISDLAYEVEYLISSHVVGNMHVWYLNLRLPSLIQRIKLARKGLQQKSEIHASKAMKSFENVVSLQSKEDSSTMEDNNFVDVKFDVKEKNKYRKKLELCYKNLPYYLKPCSLYFATFKKDAEISKEKLAWMWITEGYKKEKRIAEDCSISETSNNQRSLSFVCINKHKEEEILKHLHKLKCICGRDVIFPDMTDLWNLVSVKIFFEISSRGIIVPNLNFPHGVRKLGLTGATLTGEHMSIIGELSYLQVLKLENHAFVGDEWNVSAFVFKELRVLKIESSNLRKWSCGNGSFKKLELLVVTGCTKLEEIPRDLWYNIYPLERIEVMKCGMGVYLSLSRINDIRYVDKVVDVVTDKNLEQAVLQDIKLHDGEAFPDPPSTKHLSDYLENHGPRNWNTCTFVVHYVMQFLSNLDNREFHDVVTGLDRIARSYWERKHRLKGYSCSSYETEKKQKEFSELFVNSFIPEVQKFFKVSKLQQLIDKDKFLNPNDILAAFIDFLIQVLHREENISLGEEQRYSLIRNQLSFHLAVLGDIPFQLSHPGSEEEVNNILQEFELLANEAGSFIHSCVFSVQPLDVDWFRTETSNLLAKAEFLNVKIKHHCSKFSELHTFVVPRSVVDSFFIFDSLIEDIENLENGEINYTDEDGKHSQLGMLKEELKTLKTVIKVVDQIRPGTDANEDKDALIEVRDLAYKAEYLINSHVVGNIPAWYLNIRLPSIVQEIKIVNERLQKLVKKLQDSNVLMKASYGETSSRTRPNPATTGQNDFLNFNDDMEENILGDLIRRLKTSRQIILLSGMPGLGKTTTATKLYNSQEVSEYFDQRAWCVVSQGNSLRALYLQILRDIASDGDNKDLLKMETAELGVTIHKKLYRRRYLVVLDDVWGCDVLDELVRYLPEDGNGSRVMVTSRVKDVAPDGSILHQLPLLSHNQCWDLLKKKVFPEDSCPLQLKDVGKEIAEKCCGIPLAVVSTAGILATLEKEKSVWERVGKQLDVLLLEDERNYRKILELSYEYLPRNLKPCFLYFAAFPEDAEISKKRLTWTWISGRFIPKEGNKDPEEIAELYFLDLINRNLVMPAKRGFDGRIRTCKIHDLLHDICIVKANEHNFFKTTNSAFSIYEKHQGLYLPSSSKTTLRPFGFHCRSFKDCHTNQTSYLRTMALLKTVELPPKKYNFLYPRFDLPVQLRYLGIGDLEKRIVANLVSLEFVHVRSDDEVVLPSVILGMVKLKHLEVRKIAKFEMDCNISSETNLRSLSKVWIKGKKDEDILRHSPYLQKLNCLIGGEILFPDLSAHAELESLRINYEQRFSGQILLSEASFPLAIKKLCIHGGKLPWEKMSIIGKLPKLEVLKLEWDAFVGEEWETNDDEFQELRFLKIDMLDLGQWTSESSHFPRLEKLVMHNCRKLFAIPSDLGYIQSLQRIELWRCIEWATSSAEKIKKEQRENGNTQLQVYTSEPVTFESTMGTCCIS